MPVTISIPVMSWMIAMLAFIVLVFFLFAMVLYLRRCISSVSQKYQDTADLSSAVALLKADKEKLEQYLTEQKEELLKVQGEREEQESVRQAILAQEARLKELESAAERLVAMQVEKRELEARMADKRKELEKLEEERQKALTMQDNLPEIRAEYERLQKALERKVDIDAEIRSGEERLKEQAKTITAQQARLEELKGEIKPLEDRSKELEKKCDSSERELASSQRQLAEAKTDFAALTTRIEALRAETRGNAPEKDTALKELMRPPVSLVSRRLVPKADESEMLGEFRRALRKARLQFPDRTINAFHTSLKCQDINPLTVLAGVSGTGKTLLPVKYAEFMGINQIILSVQPRWDSAQDLFGFYNYLERRYKATELARCLLRMDPYKKLFTSNEDDNTRKGLLMVLLDEMNLARPEYYFSEFLSRLELRRTVDPNKAESRNRASIELDTGTGHGSFSVWVPKNILFVGTMNEDESTQTLSDKVLDRANVLRFGKPARRRDQEKPCMDALDGGSPLSKEAWESWKKSDIRQYADDCSGWTKKLNDALAGMGRAFGFRVEEAMFSYVANYPGVRPGSNAMRLAFADQVEQKILPKLRGCDMNMPASGKSLNEIEKVIDELDDKELKDAFRISLDNANETGIFLWQGVTRF